MKLLIVRHGDPDYSIDSLTEKRLERSGIFIRTAFKAGYKGLLRFPSWESKGYGFSYFKKDGQDSRRMRLASRVYVLH